MAAHRTEDLFGGDFYVESDDVTRGVPLGGPGLSFPKAFPPGKGEPDPFAGNFEKEGFVESFGAIDFLPGAKTGPCLKFGHDIIDVPSRPLEGRSYFCVADAAPAMLDGLLDFLSSKCDAVVTPKAAKCSVSSQLVVKHKQINMKVLFSKSAQQVAVSFVRKLGDAVDFMSTTAEAAAHMATRSGADLSLAGAGKVSIPAPLNLPLGLAPPGFLAPPPLGFTPSTAPVGTYGVTEEDMEPVLCMLEDTRDAEGPVALLQLLESDVQLATKVLLERWALVEDQLRNGCVIASPALAGKVLQEAGRPDLAKTAVEIALHRFPAEGKLGRRQLARLLNQVASQLADDSALGRITQLRDVQEVSDTVTDRYLSEAALAIRSRSS